MIAAIVGGLMGGLVGLLLAVPLLATVRIIGRYIMCRLYDRDPFTETKHDKEEKPSKRPSLKLAWQAAQNRLRAKRRDKDYQENIE
jgi:hypothetical protein